MSVLRARWIRLTGRVALPRETGGGADGTDGARAVALYRCRQRTSQKSGHRTVHGSGGDDWTTGIRPLGRTTWVSFNPSSHLMAFGIVVLFVLFIFPSTSFVELFGQYKFKSKQKKYFLTFVLLNNWQPKKF